MHAVLLPLALLWAFFGHVTLCLVLVNRAHGTRISTSIGKLLWLSIFAIVPGVPALFGYWFWLRADRLGGAFTFDSLPPAALPYLATCWIAGGAVALEWLARRGTASTPAAVRSDRRRVFRLLRDSNDPRGGARSHHFLVRLPGNQTLDLDVVERGLDLPRLPSALDRMTLLHLSDLHFTGRVPKGFFEEVAQICNDLDPDLVAVTGDLMDSADFLDWIPDTLGRLTSRYGNYFVLGNHDLEVGAGALRAAMVNAGFVDLGGRWIEVAIGETPLVLAGNELPWVAPAADFSNAPASSLEGGPTRIVLAHSPDQLPWAQRHEVDLLLAGHLHGGQIRLPLIGPIVSPSRRGVRYASGVFEVPPTLMHVTRGVSGEIPLRLNCAPEVAKLTLHAGPCADGAG